MSRLDFEFEYGRVNQKLYTKVLLWKRHEAYGGYVITGPSSSGKTLLLKELERELSRSSYMQGYEILEGLYQDIINGCINPKLSIDETCECIFIDHLDDIAGKQAATDEVHRVLKKAEYNRDSNKRLVVCTFVDGKIAENFAALMNYEVIHIKNVKPNLCIVGDKARELDIRLSKDRIRDYAELENMFELRQSFCEIERDVLSKEYAESESKIAISEYKLILTSRGLNTILGKELIIKVLDKEKLKPTSIFLMTLPVYEVDEIVVKHCKEVGFTDIYKAKDYEGIPFDDMPNVDYIFVTEGNTFEVVDYIRRNHFDDYIKKQVVGNSATYIGSSAGAIYAASNFKEAENFDSNFVGMNNCTGLMLLPHEDGVGNTILPHYTFKQLQTYISNMDEIDKSRYSKIFNISNEEALILDCKRITDGSYERVELLKKRRIRQD